MTTTPTWLKIPSVPVTGAYLKKEPKMSRSSDAFTDHINSGPDADLYAPPIILEDAKKLLEKHGYTVIPPVESVNETVN